MRLKVIKKIVASNNVQSITTLKYKAFNAPENSAHNPSSQFLEK